MGMPAECFRALNVTSKSKRVDGSLAWMLNEVAAGWFPPADGSVTIMPPPSRRDAGVLGFTAHAVIFIDADPAWVTGQLPEGDLASPLSPAFLQALCDRTGHQAHTVDILCVAPALPGPPPIALSSDHDVDHPGWPGPCATATACRLGGQTGGSWRSAGASLAGGSCPSRWTPATEVSGSAAPWLRQPVTCCPLARRCGRRPLRRMWPASAR